MARKAGPRKSAPRKSAEDRVIDEALKMAADGNWSDVSMRELAARAKIPPAELYQHFHEPNDIADAWFHRAMAAMLASQPRGFQNRPARERLQELIGRWFDYLSPHHRASVAMIAAKLHPPHIHHWAPLPFALSRHIQLLRDAAGLTAMGRRRQIEEIGLSALLVATLRVWCTDESEGQEKTRAYLTRQLARADTLMARLFGVGSKA